MRQNVLKKGIVGSFLTLFMVLMFVFGTILNVQASTYEEDQRGSFTLSLKKDLEDRVELLSDIEMKLYKVGYLERTGMVRFVLDPELEYTGVDFADLKTAEASMSVASKLAEFMPASSVEPIVSYTGEDGTVVFDDLEEGMYLIVKGDNASYLEVAPMLMSIPYMETAEIWIYDVNAYPKSIIHDIPTSLKITKRVYTIDEELNLVLTPVDAIYTVGLFLDEEGTIPVNEHYKQDIHLVNAASGSVVYDNLPEGTYYLFEIDEDGELVPLNRAYENKYGELWSTIITNEDDEVENEIEIIYPDYVEKEYFVNNYFYEDPSAYYFEGQISITKNVLINGEKAEVDDTFYAGIFRIAEDGSSELLKVVTLKQNDTVVTSVPLNLVEGIPVTTEYEVYETDENGDPVGEDFEYKVTGGGKVVIEEPTEPVNVTITNAKETEEEPPVTTVTPSPGTNVPPSGSDVPPPVQTGDDTPIMMLIALLVVTLGIVAALLVVIRKRNKR